MLDVGIIGIGNCGNQIASLAKNEMSCDVLAINSSENDLNTIPENITKFLVGDKRGAGKNRTEAKRFLKEDIVKLVSDEKFTEFMKGKDIIFIVSSTGGGTGSGMAPIMSTIIRQTFKNEDGTEKIVILIGVLPKISEALSTQVNTLEYLSELYKTLDDPTYMLYDNEKLSKESSDKMMININKSIINDMKILRGDYNYSTPYSSIDEKDMKMILDTQGRIFISALHDMKEKDVDVESIEDLLIHEIKTNTHCEIQRDQIISRTGIITNLSENLNNGFNTHIEKVQGFIGAPVEEFEHIVVNKERKLANNVFLIMAGLTAINDRIDKINDRITEIEEMQRKKESDNALELDIDMLNAKRNYRQNGDGNDQVDLKGIFSNFNID